MVYKLVVLYLIIINILGFASMGADKRRAAARRRRTPERRLMAYALLGGSAGSLLGMSVFRHKTKHRKFALGLPLVLLLQVLIAIALVIVIN